MKTKILRMLLLLMIIFVSSCERKNMKPSISTDETIVKIDTVEVDSIK